MFKNIRRSTGLLMVLLLLDTILIGFHLLHRLTFRGLLPPSIFSNTIFSMSEEAKLPDLFFYSKQVVIIALLMYVAWAKGRVYSVWAVIFSYLLIDDVVQIHERFGYALAAYTPQIGPVVPSEVAQFGFLVLLALVLFGVSLLIIRRTRGETCLISIHLMCFLALAAFFGVLVDMVQGFVMDISGISGVIKIVEDGGEMVIFSFILWYVYRLAFDVIPKMYFDRLLPRLKIKLS